MPKNRFATPLIKGTVANFLVSTGFCVIDANSTVIDANFLFYALTQRKITDKLQGIAEQSVSTYPSIKLSDIANMEIFIPPLSTQKNIAAISSALDDKIELNNKINQNLEQQAQALFRSWFIDFEPFGGKMPGDWQVSKLSECTSQIIRGFTSKYVKKSDLINLNQKVNKGNYLEKQYYKYLDERIAVPKEKFAHKKDILLNSLGQGTLGRIHFWKENAKNVVVDQHITIIRAKGEVTTAEYLYLLLSSPEYNRYFASCITGTTGMLMLNISVIRGTDVMLPTFSIQANFSNIVSRLYGIIEQKNQENIILSQLRDILLPKLMSGEIDVSKIDISDD